MDGFAPSVASRPLMPFVSTLCICSFLLSGAVHADSSASRIFEAPGKPNCLEATEQEHAKDGDRIWAERGAKLTLLGKVSPPRTVDSKDSAPVGESKFGRRYLLTGIRPWVQAKDQDGSPRRPFQVVEMLYPSLMRWSALIDLVQKIVGAIVHSRGEMRSDANDKMQLDEDVWDRERGLPHDDCSTGIIMPEGCHSGAKQELRLRISSQGLGPVSLPGAHFQSNHDEDSSQRRVLLADISPPGLWPDDDQDDDPGNEFVLL